jgi:hypothetical protein
MMKVIPRFSSLSVRLDSVKTLPLASPFGRGHFLWARLKIQISSQLMKLLAIPLSCQKTATKWLVMLRSGKNFLLTYKPYAALQNEVSV